MFGKEIDGGVAEGLFRRPFFEESPRETRLRMRGKAAVLYSIHRPKFSEEMFGKVVDGGSRVLLVRPSQREEPIKKRCERCGVQDSGSFFNNLSEIFGKSIDRAN